ncbi:MAG: imidazoleglycerol-phosphate dehydratase HisB [Lentisphaeria bacterium]|nr:imidazoleglycerol-phosphate dehydratase HisB [Lentisphaeria bacterium]
MAREAQIKRDTRETRISLTLSLDGSDAVDVSTGLPFLDHMLEAFARHGRLGLQVEALGDLQVDAHHTIEDIGLVLGDALREALGDKSGVTRFGTAYVPMDETLARVCIDLSGRPCLGYRLEPPSWEVGGFNTRLFREFFQAFVNRAGVTLHIDLISGEEVHHVFEAVFKAFGRALDQAARLDPRCTGVPSTKGMLD